MYLLYNVHEQMKESDMQRQPYQIYSFMYIYVERKDRQDYIKLGQITILT